MYNEQVITEFVGRRVLLDNLVAAVLVSTSSRVYIRPGIIIIRYEKRYRILFSKYEQNAKAETLRTMKEECGSPRSVSFDRTRFNSKSREYTAGLVCAPLPPGTPTDGVK